MLGSAPDRMLRRHGSVWTLMRRIAAPGPNQWTAGVVTDAVYYGLGRALGFAPNRIIGLVQDGDLALTLESGFPVAPQPGDLVAEGLHGSKATGEWMHIVSQPKVVREGGAVACHKLHVRR
jgi:hypothetical protein